MPRLTLISLLTAIAFTAIAIVIASGPILAGEGCDKAAKSGETTTKADPPKPLTASTR